MANNITELKCRLAILQSSPNVINYYHYNLTTCNGFCRFICIIHTHRHCSLNCIETSNVKVNLCLYLVSNDLGYFSLRERRLYYTIHYYKY